MCMGGTSLPPPTPAPEPAPPPPRAADANVKKSRSDEKRRSRAAAGRKSTILTDDKGLSGQQTAGKSLLGQ